MEPQVPNLDRRAILQPRSSSQQPRVLRGCFDEDGESHCCESKCSCAEQPGGAQGSMAEDGLGSGAEMCRPQRYLQPCAGNQPARSCNKASPLFKRQSSRMTANLRPIIPSTLATAYVACHHKFEDRIQRTAAHHYLFGTFEYTDHNVLAGSIV